jgi:hypothetical protein
VSPDNFAVNKNDDYEKNLFSVAGNVAGGVRVGVE